jgi:bifunctional DNA-binding transcriptional regulator/antitoxin component of YhaV-PrlF toxin-antitoxin module
MEKRFLLEVKQNGDEYYLEFPDELLAQTGWKIGDTLVWKDRKDGSWTLKKKVDTKKARLLQKKE